MPSGPTHARILFIGEALGGEEAIAGEAFVGSAGGVLSRVLRRAGVDRSHVRIYNVVNCRPPNDYLSGAPWEAHAVAQCRQYLQPVIDQLPDGGVIVPLGGVPLRAILNLWGVPGIAVKDFHGTVSASPDGRHWVVPTYHPSHLQRGAMNLLDVVTEDIKLAASISERGFTRSASQIVVDPPVEWYAAWVDDHLVKTARDPEVVGLALDTEFVGKSDDESEVLGARGVTLTRINGGNDGTLGWTVPYAGEYIRHTERLLKGVSDLRGFAWLWNKYADVEPLLEAGHTLSGIETLDLMWLAHHLHSDLPLGLGFWAPMASDYGPWKHQSKNKETEGLYAGGDGLQTTRVGMWLIKAAHKLGMMEMFLRDWHERDRYVLRPSHDLGVPVNKPALVAYHEDMQRKLGVILGRIKATAAKGVLKPKLGYAKRPKGKACPDCAGAGAVSLADGRISEPCARCNGPDAPHPGFLPPVAPASVIGKVKPVGGEAKLEYLTSEVKLVEATITIDLRCCETCGATAVGPKHRCPLPVVAAAPRPRRRRKSADPVPDAADVQAVGGADAGGAGPRSRPASVLVLRAVQQTRWFWQLPFNPDAPAQIIAYLQQQGIDAPVDRKKLDAQGKPKKTTKKDALKQLAKDHSDDPFFQLQLDWKAVQKVDSTYAVGTLRRLDSDDRVHPEYLPKPSTLRDSAVNPNLTNVVADKSGPEGLASGFRRCIEARHVVPPGTTPEAFAAWQQKWGS